MAATKDTHAASVKLISLTGPKLDREAEARELPSSTENRLFKSKDEGALREVLKHDVAPHAEGWARFLYTNISAITIQCGKSATKFHMGSDQGFKLMLRM